MQLLSKCKLFLRSLSILFVVMVFAAGQVAYANNFDTKADFAYLYDYNTDTVLLDKNGEMPMAPSSMTKLMTLYILFASIERGDITLDTKFPVSEKAWRKGGSKMFVKEGDDISVEDLIRGIIIQSGNDACIVVAEGLAGSEAAFAEDMNFIAEQIGMTDSHFKNSTGWPDEEHVMSAKDLVTLSKHLIEDFPEHYKYFAEKEFTYSKITQPNRNRLLYRNIGADGLKTGHTEIAGYGITASAEQKGRRLILVVNGLNSDKARISESERLLRHGFRDFKNITLYKKGDIVDSAEVWGGSEKSVGLEVAEDLEMTVAKRVSQRAGVRLIVSYDSPIPASIKKGDKLASLIIKKEDDVIREVPLVAANDVNKLSFFGRFMRVPSQIFSGE